MKLSINNGSSAVYTGHGHVVMKMMSNLTTLGHSVLMNRAAPLEINFCHPNHYTFNSETSYKVGYTAWESTWIKQDWGPYMDLVDEFWVPSKFCYDVFSQYTDKDIHIFGHGVDSVFEPIERKLDDRVNFLHNGFPAFRKNTHGVVNTFLEMYAGRKDVHLTVKGYEKSYFPINEPNITFIQKHMTYPELTKLMGDNHIMLYPSWGEGYGLIPLQAMATGMPTIMTKGWSDYDHLAGSLLIDSSLEYSPWQIPHPGKMFKPDMEHFALLMQYSLDNVEDLIKKFTKQAPQIHQEFNWTKVIKEHFDSVEARLMV